jgi:hypothetical protein
MLSGVGNETPNTRGETRDCLESGEGRGVGAEGEESGWRCKTRRRLPYRSRGSDRTYLWEPRLGDAGRSRQDRVEWVRCSESLGEAAGLGRVYTATGATDSGVGCSAKRGTSIDLIGTDGAGEASGFEGAAKARGQRGAVMDDGASCGARGPWLVNGVGAEWAIRRRGEPWRVTDACACAMARRD